MIQVEGSASRSFQFPAPINEAYAYYINMQNTLNFLKHISILRHYGDGKYRMQYHTTELGFYRVRIICDIQVNLDGDQKILQISPTQDLAPVKDNAGLYSTNGQGEFQSNSVFVPINNHTQIDYRLSMKASLPIPYALRLMPINLLNDISNSIVAWRMNEIIEIFIEKSIQTYQGPHSR